LIEHDLNCLEIHTNVKSADIIGTLLKWCVHIVLLSCFQGQMIQF